MARIQSAKPAQKHQQSAQQQPVKSASPSRAATPTKSATASPTKSATASAKSAPVQAQAKNVPPPTVYRAQPAHEHPDDAFNSGAWMFDTSRVPTWMAAQLPKTYAAPVKARSLPLSAPVSQVRV